MPYLSSLFALLLIGALFTWTTTFHFIESVWERQALKYTEQSMRELNRAKHELLVLEAYSKACSNKKEAENEDSTDKSQTTRKERIIKKRKEKISEIQREKRNPKRASRYLHLNSLFDPSVSLDDPTAKSALFILHRLSALLFHTQGFYDQLDLDSFYKSTLETARKPVETNSTQSKKGNPGIKKSKDLANLEMPTPQEQYFLYKILRGGGAALVGAKGSYHSLLEFISLEKRPTLLNLYLAPRTLLFALFGKEDIVDHVCEYRLEIYHKLDKKNDSKDELEQQFRSEFESIIPHEVPGTLIDFQISLTRPSVDHELLDENLLELP